MRSANQITCAAELESLPVFRKFIDKVCKQKLDDGTCYDLKLGFDEACTNIITYGYAGMNPGSIMLKIKLDDDKIIMSITDFGHPCEPYQPEKPDVAAGLDNLEMGGFGLFFLYEIMDEIAYAVTEDGNTLTLTKRLAPTCI